MHALFLLIVNVYCVYYNMYTCYRSKPMVLHFRKTIKFFASLISMSNNAVFPINFFQSPYPKTYFMIFAFFYLLVAESATIETAFPDVLLEVRPIRQSEKKVTLGARVRNR